jgi:hypothetical protein
MKKIILLFILSLFFSGYAQVTKSSISGLVKSNKGESLPGATVEVVHQPTGTKYYATTGVTGSYSIPAIRPGGPYLVKVSFVGFKTNEVTEVSAPLGNNVTVNVVLQDELTELQEVTVVATKPNSVFSKSRTGASQQFSTREINAVPVLGSRSITAITKYNANAGAGGSFGGQDSRLNNITIDGSVFNNGFGLGGDSQAGGRTGSTAISLDAIEQIQVNIAPFDVRQSGFTGTGINAVTRSGTNEIEGSVFHSFRSNKESFIGTKAGKTRIVPNTFDEKIYGLRIGAPIIKDKVFFFGNYEQIDNLSPATTWTASNSPIRGSQISAPTVEDLNKVSTILRGLGYETGPYENFDAERISKKFLTRLDWNINDDHKLTTRFVFHNSSSDEQTSNSSSLGFGGRRSNPNSIAYKNSGYVIKDNTRSIVVELDSKIDTWNNNFIAGYDYQNEDRALQGGGLFPTIDIKKDANNYIAAGLDPFTQGNKLNYSTLHFTNNITRTIGKHSLVFGANFERFVSNNLFFSGSNGVYIFNSLADFESLTNGLAVGAISDADPTKIARFQYRYSALPGGAEPLQVVKSNKIDLYAQDNIKVNERFNMTVGLRASRVSFKDTALENPAVTALTFANGEKFNTGDMPDAQYLFEPRLGFNLDLLGNASTQLRGGTGIFSGRPPFVFLSNAIGNNGVLTGFIDVSGENLQNGGYGFTTNTSQFIPKNPTLPSTFDLAFTAKDYKFPQTWKTNIAVDQKLPFGFVGTIESIFSKNINEVFYYNANFNAPVGTLNGIKSGDNRPFYSNNDNITRINNNVSNAIVLSNSNQGYFYSTTLKLEYPYKNGLSGSIAYTRSEAYDLLSAGSVAAGSWTGARSVNGNNNLPLAISSNNTPHRFVGTFGYRINYGKENFTASTGFNIGYIGEQTGAYSYTYGGDVNGDRVIGNDLLFVPNKASDLRFVDITQTVGGVPATTTTPAINGTSLVLYTAAQQAEAFDKFIDQDPYLSKRRGQYVERNSNILPMLHRIDLSVTQDFNVKIGGKKNSFQFRADILNFTNLLNRNWGISQRGIGANLLNVARNQDANGSNDYIPGYQLGLQTNEQGKSYLAKDTFQKNASVFDVWQAQFTLRYTFGN